MMWEEEEPGEDPGKRRVSYNRASELGRVVVPALGLAEGLDLGGLHGAAEGADPAVHQKCPLDLLAK